jgi:hypothetical protein
MKKLLLLLSVAVPFFATPALALNPLYEEFSRVKEVAVYVATPTDNGATKLDTQAFHKALEDTLKARKSIRFAPVAFEQEAKLVVEADFKGFVFSETDPVDMLVGVGAVAADAAIQDHFASTEVVMTVREPSGKVRWTDTVRASITDHSISEADARVKILERAAELFVRAAFGKK